MGVPVGAVLHHLPLAESRAALQDFRRLLRPGERVGEEGNLTGTRCSGRQSSNANLGGQPGKHNRLAMQKQQRQDVVQGLVFPFHGCSLRTPEETARTCRLSHRPTNPVRVRARGRGCDGFAVCGRGQGRAGGGRGLSAQGDGSWHPAGILEQKLWRSEESPRRRGLHYCRHSLS